MASTPRGQLPHRKGLLSGRRQLSLCQLQPLGSIAQRHGAGMVADLGAGSLELGNGASDVLGGAAQVLVLITICVRFGPVRRRVERLHAGSLIVLQVLGARLLI